MGEISSQSQAEQGQQAQLEAIDDPLRIAALVQRVVSERLFVTVALSDGHEDYNSTVLGLEPGSEVFLLDALYPDQGNEVLRQQGWLRLTARFDGTSATFTSRLVGEGENAGIRYFRIQLPERVDYAQRRSRYRVPVESIQDVPVMLERVDGGTVLGSLHDMSASGISIHLPISDPATFTSGQIIPYCVVRIPDDEPIVAGIELRDVREADGGGLVLGARFVEVDRIAEQRIDRFVAAAERRLLKNRNGED